MSASDAGRTEVPLVAVDAANVVGSVPDGWWRDRAAATERLRDALAALAREGVRPDAGAPPWSASPPLDVVLVVEGSARTVASAEGVRVLAAAGTADDAIVSLLSEQEGHRRCLVVTADRELRSRARALGADVTGPRAVWPAAADRHGDE